MTDVTEPLTGVEPRGLVPTEREEQRGHRVEDYEFRAPEMEGPPKRRDLRSFLSDLDPRQLGGPVKPIVILGLVSFLGEWDDQALGILLPEMRTDFGFSLEFLIRLGSLLGIVSILLAPALGWVADRFPRVWMLRIGTLTSNFASLIQGLATGVPMLVAGRTLGGVGGSVKAPASFPLMADYYPSKSRGRAFALLIMIGGAGGIVGPLVAGSLGDAFGWRTAVVTLAGVALLVTVALFFLREPVRGVQERLEMGADSQTAQNEQEPMSWGEAWRAARSVNTLRRIWYATPFMEVSGIVLGTAVGLYYAEVFGLGPRERGYIQALTGAVALAALPFAGKLADRLLAHRPGAVLVYLGALLVLNSVSVLVLALSEMLWLSVLFALPLGFAYVASLTAGTTVMSLVIPARLRGLGMQTIAPWRLAGLIFSATLLAPVIDRLGLRLGILAFIPMQLAGAAIFTSAASGVERDIRAAKAAAMADAAAREARRTGRSKMLICRDVDVTYDGTQVLFGVDLDVAEGEILALVGTNGAGKSTVLRAIAGTQEASNGAIFLDGRDITHVPPHENAALGIVMVPGGRAIFPTLTVSENLRTAAWMYREDEGYVAGRTEEVLGLFPVLRERLNQQAGNLSGGEQQMLALGQALLMKPRLLMIDELSLGLAPQVVEQLLETVRRIHAQGTTIILVEQSLNVALTIAERAVFMEKGEIRFDGPTADLLAQPDLVRAVFMGRAVSAPKRRKDAGMERETLLTVSGVSVRFGGVTALRGAGLEAGAGEIVGVIGPNGAGKTTLFDVISGFVVPDEGAVLLEAEDVTTMRPDVRARLGLGRSFQNVLLFPSMTVRDNIAVAFERHLAVRNPLAAAAWTPRVRAAERRIARRVDGLIAMLGLEAYADKFVNELSTGTRRATDIACVMAAQPRVLLLDEPSSGLAQAETEELGPVLRRLATDTGAAIVVIEHDLPLISTVSDRLVAMDLGRVLVSGPPDEVLADEQVMAAYLTASDAVIGRSDVGRAKKKGR